MKAPKSLGKKSNKPQKLALGGWADRNKEELSAAGKIIGATGQLASLGGTALAASNSPNDIGKINVNKATTSSALTGLGTGAKTGAALGTAFGPLGTLIGGAGGALVGGTIGAISGHKNAQKLNTSIDQQIAEDQKQKLIQQQQQNLASAMLQRNTENFKDGGKVPYNKSLVPLQNKQDSTMFKSGYDSVNKISPDIAVDALNKNLGKATPLIAGLSVKQSELNNKMILSNQEVLKRAIDNDINGLSMADVDRVQKLKESDEFKKYSGYKNGGEIKGKGTGTSDSIKAKIKPGSFVVPKKNAEVAEELREKVLGTDNKEEESKEANLRQGGGVDVKLSNGEHLFTPEEVKELAARGIDLNKLAPDAKAKLGEHLNCGGTVKGYARGGLTENEDDYEKFISEKKKELELKKSALEKAAAEKNKTEAERRKLEEEKIAYGYAKERFDESVKKYQSEKQKYQKLETLLSGKDPSYSAAKYIDEKTKISKLEEQLGNVEKTKKEINERVSVLNKYSANEGSKKTEAPSYFKNQSYDSFLPKKQEKELKDAPKTDNFVLTEEGQKAKAELDTKKNNSSNIPTPIPAPKLRASNTNQTAKTNEPVEQLKQIKPVQSIEEPSLRPMMPQTKEEILLDSEVKKRNESSSQSPDWTSALGAVSEYALPAIQIGLANKYLQKAGSRPIDKIDPDYLAAIAKTRGIADAAQKRASYGYSPEEMAAINAQNANLTNAERFAARNYSGGSSSAALNNERSALNNSYSRGLAAMVANKNLQLQKQEYADQMNNPLNALLGNKLNYSRQLFGDKLNAFNQNQQAGSELLSAGLSNAISSKRYLDELASQREMAAKYGINPYQQ